MARSSRNAVVLGVGALFSLALVLLSHHPGSSSSSSAPVSELSTTSNPNKRPEPPKRSPRDFIDPIAYGTAWKKEATATLVEEAIRQGFRMIDTAGQPRHYREDLVGLGVENAVRQGLIRSRQELILETKFTPPSGQDLNNMPYDPHDPLEKMVETSLQSSLRNLRTTYIDIYLLHSPMSTFAESARVWRAMEAAVDRGTVSALGVSNVYAQIDEWIDFFRHKARHRPIVIQNRFVKDMGYSKQLRRFCAESGAHFETFWTLTGNPHILQSPQMVALSSSTRLQKFTREQIFFRFLTQRGLLPLSGTRSRVHMQQDLAATERNGEGGVPLLSAAELQTLDPFIS